MEVVRGWIGRVIELCDYTSQPCLSLLCLHLSSLHPPPPTHPSSIPPPFALLHPLRTPPTILAARSLASIPPLPHSLPPLIPGALVGGWLPISTIWAMLEWCGMEDSELLEYQEYTTKTTTGKVNTSRCCSGCCGGCCYYCIVVVVKCYCCCCCIVDCFVVVNTCARCFCGGCC